MKAGMIQPRPYWGTDELANVLRFVGECNALTDFCASVHPGDVLHLMSRDLTQHIYLVEDEQEKLIALVQLYPPASQGYDLLIHPDYRGGELENALIVWGERAQWSLMQPAGDYGPSVGCDVFDTDVVREKMLQHAGYTTAGEPYQCLTIRSLLEPIPDTVLPDGFSIRNVEGTHEADALGEVRNSAFGSNWQPGEYLKAMCTPGFVSDRELVVVAPDGRLAAFLVYWIDPISKSGLFQPVGCHPDFRRRGLTKALMFGNYTGIKPVV